MSIAQSSRIDPAPFAHWYAQGWKKQSVESFLLQQGMDATSVEEHWKAYCAFCSGKKQFKGFFFMALGAFLGFVSCVLSLTNPIPELYNVILFGLTSVAILIIVLGMYFLFE